MKKLNLEATFSKGYWKGKTVQQVADENFYQFRAHLNKYPYLYNEDVFDYVSFINDKIAGYHKSKHYYAR